MNPITALAGRSMLLAISISAELKWAPVPFLSLNRNHITGSMLAGGGVKSLLNS